MERPVPEAVLMIGEEESTKFDNKAFYVPVGASTRIFLIVLVAALVTYVILQILKSADKGEQISGLDSNNLYLQVTAGASFLAVLFAFTDDKVWWWFLRWFMIIAGLSALVIFLIIVARRLDDNKCCNECNTLDRN